MKQMLLSRTDTDTIPRIKQVELGRINLSLLLDVRHFAVDCNSFIL